MIGAFVLLLRFVPCCPVNNNFAYVWLLELIVENVAMWGHLHCRHVAEDTMKLQADELPAETLRQYQQLYPLSDSSPHGPWCHAETNTNHGGSRYRFTCTRDKSHAGPHVAHVPSGQIIAVWGQL